MKRNWEILNFVVNNVPLSLPHLGTLDNATVFRYIGPAMAITATLG